MLVGGKIFNEKKKQEYIKFNIICYFSIDSGECYKCKKALDNRKYSIMISRFCKIIRKLTPYYGCIICPYEPKQII